jgi:hypothetical protein
MTAAPGKVACVEIGGIPIALSTCDEGFLNLLRQRYDGFLSSSPPEFELEFDLAGTGPASDDDVRVRRNIDDDEWLIERGDFPPAGPRAPDEATCAKMPTRILSIRCCAFCTA